MSWVMFLSALAEDPGMGRRFRRRAETWHVMRLSPSAQGLASADARQFFKKAVLSILHWRR